MLRNRRESVFGKAADHFDMTKFQSRLIALEVSWLSLLGYRPSHLSCALVLVDRSATDLLSGYLLLIKKSPSHHDSSGTVLHVPA